MPRKAYEAFTCSCGERCVMVPHHPSGKLAPITEATYDNGNIAHFYTGGGRGPFYVVLFDDEIAAEPGMRPLSHYATCPDAGRFRK